LLNLTLDALKTGLRELAILGAHPPVIGHELADDRGTVVAEAEMAWITNHVVLLTFDQADLADAWVTAGWQVLVLDENTAMVDGAGWPGAVASKLGMAGFHKLNEEVTT
jgi:DEAD/DEAH box helicase domain-containing protein